MTEEEKEKIKILHVANISTAATKDHIYNMFNYLGKIAELRIYPSENNITPNITSKAAFIKYDDERCVEVGQHLTNVVLIDQALICIPYLQNTIPDEDTYFNSGGVPTAGQRQLPPHVVNKTQEIEDGTSLLLTVDPTLEQLGLPQYPPLPGDTDLAKVEEIRRTVYVGNLPKGIDGQAVLDFFNMYVGEVMYVRMATGPQTLPCAYAYVEFSSQTSVPIALQNNGIDFQGRQRLMFKHWKKLRKLFVKGELAMIVNARDVAHDRQCEGGVHHHLEGVRDHPEEIDAIDVRRVVIASEAAVVIVEEEAVAETEIASDREVVTGDVDRNRETENGIDRETDRVREIARGTVKGAGARRGSVMRKSFQPPSETSDEDLLREKLLEKQLARKDTTSDSEWEEKGVETKNERKRRVSDSE
ncbi:unnamed protein product [Caenorhabditis bovis]|uniref:RRM domain-containing protein n=1 Tax=Caenorhabditis bovis TaxID=2654633 RepID=A0A8S1FEC3_9PELO|nr:unnamed protein product [Caenorhabditis bovis]